MRKIIMCLVVVMTGCASKPEIAKLPDFEIRAMSRSEVVSAANECESNEMKPFVEYITQKTEFGKVLVPVNVHCNPLKRTVSQIRN
jgi:PBP1b-binding outer membrane lipoprotein LpoB